MRASRKIKKLREDPVAKLAKVIGLPPAQVKPDLRIVDAPNPEAGNNRTLRKPTKLEKLHRLGVITERELLVCEWYHEAHSLRYDTVGITAKYGDCHGGSPKRDHLPSSRKQEEAFRNFEFAREGITPAVRQVFDRVVLHGFAIGRLGFMFRLALNQLAERIEGRVQL